MTHKETFPEWAANEGGPAFPFVYAADNYFCTGMTLRDYFAAKAPDVPNWFEPMAARSALTQNHMDRLIKWRFVYADAMLAERAK